MNGTARRVFAEAPQPRRWSVGRSLLMP